MEYNIGDRVELTEDGKVQFASDTYLGPYVNQQGTVVGTEDPGDDSILHVRFDDGNVAEFGKGVIVKVVAP